MFPSPSPSNDDPFKVVYDSPVALGMARASESGAGRFEVVNQALCGLLGYSEEELLSLSPLEITHPDDRELTAVYHEQLFRGEIDSYDVEKRW
jgi:PAS domain S-box-containing protein